jgi:hypothetical protein
MDQMKLQGASVVELRGPNAFYSDPTGILKILPHARGQLFRYLANLYDIIQCHRSLLPG